LLFKINFFDEFILGLKMDGKNEFGVFINETKYGKELNNISNVIDYLEHKTNQIPNSNNISLDTTKKSKELEKVIDTEESAYKFIDYLIYFAIVFVIIFFIYIISRRLNLQSETS